MKIQNTEIFKLHAEFCGTLANQYRLMIVAILAKREMSVGEMADIIGIRMANISQNLSALRAKNIVKSRKEGQMVYYSLVDPRLLEGCMLIRSVLLEDMKHRGQLAKDFDVSNIIVDE